MNSSRIYLDCNATTPVDPEVMDLYAALMRAQWGNPSSVHREGQVARSLLVDAKQRIKAALHIPKSYEVYFFSSATEAINTLIKGVASFSRRSLGEREMCFLSSEFEHAAVYESLKSLKHLMPLFQVAYTQPTLIGSPSINHVVEVFERAKECGIHSIGAAFMAVNNETGVINEDLPKIAQFLSRQAVPLIVDGVALLGKAPVAFYEGVSAFIFSGHKIHAPKGIAVAVVDKQLRFDPLIFGGSQENGKRAGTENPPLAQALALAIEKSISRQAEDLVHMEKLQQLFEQGIFNAFPKGSCSINGSGRRVFSTSNIAFGQLDGEDLLMSLDLKGIAASHGSACSSGALEPSRVLLKMGCSHERASSSLRFSWSRLTTQEEVEVAVQAIISSVQSLNRYM